MIGELIPTGVTFGVGRNSINDAFSGTAELNNIILESGGNFSGGTGGGVFYSGGTDLYSIFSTGVGGSVNIDPYNDLGDVASLFTWNVSGDSTNYEVTLTAATTTINLINVRNGEYGTIIINQDTVGSRLLSFGTVNGGVTTHRVSGGGGGSPVLTSNSNAKDILTFTYNGSIMYWTIGNDYT